MIAMEMKFTNSHTGSEASMPITLGALVIIAWVAFCVMPTIDEWLSDRREMKEIDRANKAADRNNRQSIGGGEG